MTFSNIAIYVCSSHAQFHQATRMQTLAYRVKPILLFCTHRYTYCLHYLPMRYRQNTHNGLVDLRRGVSVLKKNPAYFASVACPQPFSLDVDLFSRFCSIWVLTATLPESQKMSWRAVPKQIARGSRSLWKHTALENSVINLQIRVIAQAHMNIQNICFLRIAYLVPVTVFRL